MMPERDKGECIVDGDDAAIHEEILADGDDAAAQKISDTVAQRLGIAKPRPGKRS